MLSNRRSSHDSSPSPSRPPVLRPSRRTVFSTRTLPLSEALESRQLLSGASAGAAGLAPVGPLGGLFVPARPADQGSNRPGGPSQNPTPGPVTRVPFTNGGFENFPDFTGWQVDGNATVRGKDFYPPPQGTAQAVLSTTGAGAAPAASLESFLNLNAGALSKQGAINGTAIKQTVTGAAGDVISFQYNFLTDDRKRDFAFLTLTDPNGNTRVVRLDRFALHATSPTVLGMTLATNETGYHTVMFRLPKAGTYTVGFGVANVGDAAGRSTLLLDNVQLTPGPGKGHGDGDGHGGLGGDDGGHGNNGGNGGHGGGDDHNTDDESSTFEG